MHTRTLSISLKEDLIEKLKNFVPAKKISKFVSTVINNELAKAEQELERAYSIAEEDQERQSLLKEWNAADDFFTK